MSGRTKDGSIRGMLGRAFRNFREDDCPRMAAAMSYFTVFSLPALLVVILVLVGLWIDPADVQGRIRDEMARVVGADAATMVQDMVTAADRARDRGPVATAVGLVTLLLGATGAFGELQAALNRAWEVKPDPSEGGIKALLLRRILSLGMVATIAFLLLVSMVLSAALSAFGNGIGDRFGGLSGPLLQALQTALSLGVTWMLFVALFKVLPDAHAAWKDLLVGAGATTVLFGAGKLLIGVYLAKANPGTSFGAAGALALILVWIYYSAMIVFFGAELTQVWANERGSGIEPKAGAVRA